MNQFKTSIEWGDFERAKQQHCYLQWLLELFNSANNNQHNVADCLADIVERNGLGDVDVPQFIDQSAFSSDPRYYEQIIADSNQVPSRESSWHDFFNGLIWLQFPSTKKLLNRLHIEQIQKFGVHPRTLVRNQITHFDECGLVLVGTDPKARDIINALEKHQWDKALLQAKSDWHTVLHPIVFGHANLEMLLNPFMSLTSKWLYIECPDIEISNTPSLESLARIDVALTNHLCAHQFFASKGNLKPLPLMGVPDWCKNQDADFYLQTDFFRPLNRNVKNTK